MKKREAYITLNKDDEDEIQCLGTVKGKACLTIKLFIWSYNTYYVAHAFVFYSVDNSDLYITVIKFKTIANEYLGNSTLSETSTSKVDSMPAKKQKKNKKERSVANNALPTTIQAERQLPIFSNFYNPPFNPSVTLSFNPSLSSNMPLLFNPCTPAAFLNMQSDLRSARPFRAITVKLNHFY